MNFEIALRLSRMFEDNISVLEKLIPLIDGSDSWIVGGSARKIVYDLDVPWRDLDICINLPNDGKTVATAGLSAFFEAFSASHETGSGQQGLKITSGVNKIDVWDHNLTQWLDGVPCIGDSIAVNPRTGDVVVGDCYSQDPWRWADANPAWLDKPRNPADKEKATKYYARHSLSLARDRQSFLSKQP